MLPCRSSASLACSPSGSLPTVLNRESTRPNEVLDDFTNVVGHHTISCRNGQPRRKPQPILWPRPQQQWDTALMKNVHGTEPACFQPRVFAVLGMACNVDLRDAFRWDAVDVGCSSTAWPICWGAIVGSGDWPVPSSLRKRPIQSAPLIALSRALSLHAMEICCETAKLSYRFSISLRRHCHAV
jgi:hypothetical protein